MNFPCFKIVSEMKGQVFHHPITACHENPHTHSPRSPSLRRACGSPFFHPIFYGWCMLEKPIPRNWINWMMLRGSPMTQETSTCFSRWIFLKLVCRMMFVNGDKTRPGVLEKIPSWILYHQTPCITLYTTIARTITNS